jgi:hypothetical protein
MQAEDHPAGNGEGHLVEGRPSIGGRHLEGEDRHAGGKDRMITGLGSK